MIKVNVYEAKTHLSRYLDEAAAGNRVIICRRNVPVAELLPLQQTPLREPRSIGLGRGLVKIDERFFEPLPDDLLDGFEGSEP